MRINENASLHVQSITFQIMYVDDDVFMVSGGINVLDLEGATLAHATQMSPALMKKMTVAGQVNEQFSKKQYKHIHRLLSPSKLLNGIMTAFGINDIASVTVSFPVWMF